jgi:hypothetical protein
MFTRLLHVVLTLGALGLSPCLFAGSAQAQGDLAAASANPIASMVSIPFESSWDFGADNGTAYIMNIQPVVPVRVGDWNLISRPIIPIIDVGGTTTGLTGAPIDPTDAGLASISGATGLGDINYSLFFSPANSGPLIWGVGPSVTAPTATDPLLGTEKWSAGPTAIALVQPGPWTIGMLARQIWSFAGASDRSNVNQTVLQPFVNYKLSDGWYLSSSPVMAANWEAKKSNRWTVPLGGGVGRVFKLGQQPVNMRVEAYNNVEIPQGGPDWVTKFTFQLLFPQKN